jgi:hypothetical protein
VILTAATLLGLFAGLSFWEMTGDTVTSDERIHLPAGYAYWKKREFRLNPEHPPLVKLLCSAPLLAMNLSMPPAEPEPGLNYNEYQQVFGSQFLFKQNADRIMFWGRLPALAMGLLLAFFIFLWSWRLHGHAGAGSVSLALVALEPTILAHSHYVTMDVPVACFSVMAMFFLWLFCRGGKTSHLVLASLGMAFALASKFSAIFLLPVFFLLLFVKFPPDDKDKSGRVSAVVPARTRLLVCAAVLAGISIVVQAFYFFSPDLLLYIKGVQQVNLNHVPNYLFYIHGKFFQGGVWWYPIYTLALKTAIPTIIVIAVALVSFLKSGRNGGDFVFLLLPAGIFTLAVCAFADNLGVRYMIPVTVFLLVLAGRAFLSFSNSGKARLWGGVLALWLVVSVLHASPHYISYFNEFIGGPSNAPYYLDDSNVDWGQDLKRLVEYLRGNHVSEVILSIWGPAPPEYYGDPAGIHFKPWTQAMARSSDPPAGIYAISVNNLVGIKRLIFSGADPNLDWLERFKPVERVGYSIYVYRFPGVQSRR